MNVMIRVSALGAGIGGFDHGLCHTKDVKRC